MSQGPPEVPGPHYENCCSRENLENLYNSFQNSQPRVSPILLTFGVIIALSGGSQPFFITSKLCSTASSFKDQ